MSLAFVLVNAEVGSEDQVLRELRKVACVKEAYAAYGVHDILAKAQADTMSELKEALSQNLRRIKGIRSTLTMIAMEER